MLRLETLKLPLHEWPDLSNFQDRVICQTPAWVGFLAETQNATPVLAALKDGTEIVGYFTGLVVRKFGLKVLGSSLPGWGTPFMGFNLRPTVSRRSALEALEEFAFRQLRCVHFELYDFRMGIEDAEGLGFQYRNVQSFQIDLTQSEDELLKKMDPDRRRCIRKAQEAGIVIEEAHDEQFMDEYYDQLLDVFAKQSLVPQTPLERLRALYRHLHPTGQLLLLRARDPSGRCIGTGIFPALNDLMLFWGGASYRKDQRQHPNEPIQWHAMRYWKSRGLKLYNMVGGGEYKRKYGGVDVSVPWFRKSRSRIFESARNLVKAGVDLRQRLKGRLQAGPGDSAHQP